MCLLVLAWQSHDEYPLVFAGNRDERHARATAAASFWSDTPEILGGRDLEAGGTWLGITAGRRFAVVTNFREGLEPAKALRSRGELPTDFLRGRVSPAEYARDLARRGSDYGGFSFLCSNAASLWFCSNRGDGAYEVAPGVHGLSNHLLDTPWPKVERSKQRMELLLERDSLSSGALFRLLADREPAGDDELPDTGIGRDLEKRVSAPFVVNPVYGTRCSSVLRSQMDGGQYFAERRFDAAGETLETRHFQLGATAP